MNFEAQAEGFAREFVELVERLRALVAGIRSAIAEDGTDKAPRDATAVAGFLARALLEHGAVLPDRAPQKLRWYVNESPDPREDIGAHGATSALVGCMLEALKHGAKNPDVEDVHLARAARIWVDHRTRHAATVAHDADERAEADRRHRREFEAHHQRLGAAQAAKPSPFADQRAQVARAKAAKVAQQGIDERIRANAQAREAADKARREQGEGEWSVGPDFSEDLKVG